MEKREVIGGLSARVEVVPEPLGRVPTSIICGTEDKITSIGHSRKLHSRIPGSSLLECEGAGHMVLLERHKQVTAELDDLISLALGQGAR